MCHHSTSSPIPLPESSPFTLSPTLRRSRISVIFLHQRLFRKISLRPLDMHDILCLARIPIAAAPTLHLKSLDLCPASTGRTDRPRLDYAVNISPTHQSSCAQLSSPNFVTVLQELNPNNPGGKGAWTAASLHSGRCVPPMPTRTNDNPLDFCETSSRTKILHMVTSRRSTMTERYSDVHNLRKHGDTPHSMHRPHIFHDVLRQLACIPEASPTYRF